MSLPTGSGKVTDDRLIEAYKGPEVRY